VTDTVCDNTREMALVEQGQTYKVKHSRYSGAKLADARAALAMVHTLADDFAEEIAALCAMSVSPVQWDTFLNVVVPRADARSQPLTGRALTPRITSARPSTGSTGTMTGWRRGPAPTTGCCKR